MYDLEMGQCIVLRTHAIRGARRFDSVDGSADRSVAYRVDVERETSEVESLDEFHDHAALMLQLTTRDLALVGMEAAFLDERRRGSGGLILLVVIAHLDAVGAAVST
jgi:hypothetical protein